MSFLSFFGGRKRPVGVGGFKNYIFLLSNILMISLILFRVMNKLTLAVNPRRQIPLLVEDLTGRDKKGDNQVKKVHLN